MRLVSLLFISVTNLSIIFGQNFSYSEDDWEIYSEPDRINAITETSWEIYFAADDGIYRWDKFYETMEYSSSMSRYLDAEMIYHFYYDPNSDYFWVVHNDGISFKSSIASYWQTANISVSSRGIKDIGSTDGIIWIDYANTYIAVDPYSGVEITPEENFNPDFIKWGYSQYGRAGRDIEVDEYFFQDDADDDNYLLNPRRIRQKPVISMQDSDGRLWVGTNLGQIYMSKNYSPYGTQIYMGMPDIDFITEIYNDGYGNWWITDNEYKRIGYTKIRREMSPIYQWRKDSNEWFEFIAENTERHRDITVNKMIRSGYYLYIGTLNGLVILEILEKEWTNITEGLNDPAVWDIVEKSGKLYLATARGIDIVKLKNNSLITNKPQVISEFDDVEIYDLEVLNDFLYVVCKNGVFKINLKSEEVIKLTEKVFRSIECTDDYTLLTGEGIWKLGEDNTLEQVYVYDVFKMSVSGFYVWITDMDQAVLLNLKSGQTYYYNSLDGIPGNRIFEIGCDEAWVWFGTDRGMAFYNWSRYHQ
ncbi:MAG: hypothetical protein HN729_07060 [Candidatus Marinimicrobia bacterium]|jgi:ligand-binding sensor domain-containing protein|nr:hypothetical protein [Candidatus Neomarinimicrobiota bacterium]MBT3633617.1 hypothetical protein [Candidatus Neomarinimicrobiota bacterium]MBT3682430.1 hypothetical protein [Candidatus Neomarinimicrobiota bacterium]MBT3759194.1 hypothetical protein [Candidatus Neomarinimicrobiota bacterium]MBT3895533.1 hypothetical protein [Candidatus Neomarinimicrobiota bacterium]